jgi:N6-L-threonylcarbamoyladenine synthase
MKILSIETSCDETGISIIEAKKSGSKTVFKVLANSLNSQINIHKEYGGVFPALAKREHQKNLPILFARTLKKAKITEKNMSEKIDLISVTSGPGLEPALWTGIVFAKEISTKYKIPIMPVNHMEGHILSVFAEDKKTFSIPKINFPVLSLLVSGGHTELVLMRDWMKYQIIGETLDDAAGEAFDKVARMLNLPYPGGPEVSKLAEQGRKNFKKENLEKFNIKLPRPMIYSKNFNFSFSGLKTAVLYLVRDLMKEDPKILQNTEIKKAISLEFENAVVETLIHKTKKAIEKYNIKTVVVAGGVSANKYLRKEITKLEKNNIKVFFPSKQLSTDNSIMIGIAGYFRFLEKKQTGVKHNKIKAEGNIKLK